MESIVTSAQIGYLSTTSADIQSQLTTLSASSHTHSNKPTLDSINQNLNTSSTVQFGNIKIGESTEIGALGNTKWLKVAEYGRTDSGTASKYHVRIYGGDWADQAYADYLFTSFGTYSSAYSLDVRRTHVSWEHGSNEFYYDVTWACFYSSASSTFEVYTCLSGADYCNFGADVTYTKGNTGVFKYFTSATSNLPSSATYTQVPVKTHEQAVRQVSDSLFLRNTSVPRATEYQYTDTSAVANIYFTGTSIVLPNRLLLPAGVSSASSLRLGEGIAPSSPVGGDIWYDGNYTYLQNNNGTRYQTITSGLSANYITKAIGGGRIENSSIMDDGTTVSTPNLSATTLIVGSVTNDEIQYLDTVSANIQTQLTVLSATRPTVSNGADNRIATFTNSSNLYGEPNLTWDGTTLSPSSPNYVRILIDGTNANNGIDLKSSGTNKWFIGERDSTTFAVYDYGSSNYDINITSGAGGLITLGSTTKKVNLPSLSTSAVVVTDGSKNLVSSNITTTQIGYLSTTSANIQSQLTTLSASKQNTLTNPVTGTGTAGYIPKFTASTGIGNSIIQDSGTIVTIGGHLTATNISGATLTIGTGAGQIDNTEFSYLNGVSANIQTQLNQLAVAAVSGSGAGTTNYITKFVTSSSMGNSTIIDTGSLVSFTTQVSASRINLPANSQSIYLGSNATIGDVNTTHAIGIVSQTNAALGYIKFGNDSNLFGYDGTTLVYAGTAKIGNMSATNISGTTINVGNISNTEFGYLDNVSANIQTQLTSLSATRASSSITISAGSGLTGGGDLTANRTISMPSVGTAGTYTKVSTDAQGRVSAATNITSSDVPSLGPSKIAQDSSNRFVTDSQITNWNKTSAVVTNTSANWNSVYSSVNSNSANWNTAYTNNHTHTNKANLDLVNQSLNTSSSVIFNTIHVSANGTGTNIRVGDDAYIGDINVTNAIGIKGLSDSTLGYIRFGNSSYGLGYDGTNLVYQGSTNFGNITLTTQPDGVYNGASRPSYYIGQTMATNDYWQIYGEGSTNGGRLVLEVGDDMAEDVVIKRRNTGTSTSQVYAIWSEINLQNPIDGSGTFNYIPKFSDGNTITNSSLLDETTLLTYGSGSGNTTFKMDAGAGATSYFSMYVGGSEKFGINNSAGITYFNKEAVEFMRVENGSNFPLFSNSIDIGSAHDKLVATDPTTGKLISTSIAPSDLNIANWNSAYSSLGNYLPLTGGTMAGSIVFSNVSNNNTIGLYGQVGANDGWRIVGGAPSDNNGYLEIATTDDGTEPIYVRQYNNGLGWSNYTGTPRTLTLLDGSGNTSIPGNLSAANNRIRFKASTNDVDIDNTASGNYSIHLATNSQAMNFYRGVPGSGTKVAAISGDGAALFSYISINGVDNNIAKVNGNTVWNAGNFTPSNYLLKYDTFGGSDWYTFILESGSDTGGLNLKISDNSDGSEYFRVTNESGNQIVSFTSDNTSIFSYQRYTSDNPSIRVGDGQYGIGANAGFLDLYSASGQGRIFSRSGSSNAVYVGDLWHSGNLSNPITGSGISAAISVFNSSNSITSFAGLTYTKIPNSISILKTSVSSESTTGAHCIMVLEPGSHFTSNAVLDFYSSGAEMFRLATDRANDNFYIGAKAGTWNYPIYFGRTTASNMTLSRSTSVLGTLMLQNGSTLLTTPATEWYRFSGGPTYSGERININNTQGGAYSGDVGTEFYYSGTQTSVKIGDLDGNRCYTASLNGSIFSSSLVGPIDIQNVVSLNYTPYSTVITASTTLSTTANYFVVDGTAAVLNIDLPGSARLGSVYYINIIGTFSTNPWILLKTAVTGDAIYFTSDTYTDEIYLRGGPNPAPRLKYGLHIVTYSYNNGSNAVWTLSGLHKTA